jgi:hypothetical protein
MEMQLKKEKYTLDYKENQLYFNGSVEEFDYTSLYDFLERLEAAITEDQILTFNFLYLDFLNSSGIKYLIRFLKKTPKKVIIIINSDEIWQKMGLTPLIQLRPEGQISIQESVRNG